MAGTTCRWRLAIFALLVICAGLAANGGVAFAAPGPISGLTSSTHPDQSTWYSSANPAFAWNPVLASGAAIAGYSFVLDQNPATAPDLSSDRLSLDFLSRVTNTCGNGPSEVRVGDLNGDGKQDIVTANATANTISVLLGRGDGTFNAKVDYAMNTQPWSMQLGDLNRDGRLDVVTGDLGSNRASVRLGNGDGAFGALAAYTIGSQPECLRIGDLNHDSNLDIVTTNAGANTISVLLGRGDGTFDAKMDYATSVHPTSIDLGDLNGDGNADLIAANTGPSTVSVLIGKGDGTFNAKVDYATGNTPYTVIVDDVNGDNRLDVETVNYGASSASILLGNGDGTLMAKVDYPVGAGPYALDVRDLNQDGAPDLVTTNNTANTASVLMGNGDGTFNAKTDFATGAGPFWVTLGDFNADGYGDLVTSDYTGNTASVRLGAAYLNVGFTGKADGVWYFHVRALDALGAGGTVSNRTVRIDVGPPTTTQSGADSGWHDSDVTVSLSASDSASGVAGTQYKVDAGSWTNGTSVVVPAPSNGSNDGSHTVSYRSADVAGNVEIAKTCTVNIVTSAPTTSVSGADGAWHASDVTLGFSSGSPGVTKTEYRVDGGAWVEDTAAVIPAWPDGSNDGTRTIEYRSTNGAGYVEIAQSVVVKIDAAAPTTSVSGADDAWHNSDVTLGFAGNDAGSGVAKVEYRVDGGAWVEGTSLVVVASPDGSNDGAHTIEYRSTDTAGHVEAAKTVTVKIDAGAPTTTVTGADDAWHNSDVPLDFAGSDASSAVAKTEYRVDGGAWVEGNSLVVAANPDGSNDGAHTVDYRSTDTTGNVETFKTCTAKIVTAAPTTSVSGADDAWHNGDVTLAFSSGSLGVTMTEYRIDGGAWVEGNSLVVAASPDGSNDGTHIIEYRSTNGAGYVEGVESVVAKIDVGAPTTTVSGADGAWHDSDVTLGFAGSDSGSGVARVEYRIDDGSWTDGNAALVSALGDGSNDGQHTVRYRSIDEAGNVETFQTVEVKIDVAAPTTLVSGADDVWHNSDVTLGFAGSDSGSGVAKVEYRLDGGAWTEDVSLVIAANPDGSNDGAHTVDYRSTDAAGHVEDFKSLAAKIDTTAPTTTATGGGDSWYDTDVTVTLSATDAGSAVAFTEYQIDGGAWVEGDSIVVPGPADGSNDGEHTIAYRSVDNLGNAEAAGTVAVKIGHLQTRVRVIDHKHNFLRVSWPSVAGSASYDLLVDGEVVASTDQLTIVYNNMKQAWRHATVRIEIVAKDGGGGALLTRGVQRLMP